MVTRVLEVLPLKKNKDELIKEFDILWENTKWYQTIIFYNLNVYRNKNRNCYEIITLDEFWEQDEWSKLSWSRRFASTLRGKRVARY